MTPIVTPPNTATATAGKIINGALFTKSAGNGNTTGYQTGIVAALAYTGTGLSFCGWARRTAGLANQLLAVSYQAFADAGGVTSNGSLGMNDGNNFFELDGLTTVPFNICTIGEARVSVLGTFFFFCCRLNIDGTITYQINGNAPVTSVCLTSIPDSPFGQFRFQYGFFNPAGAGQFDEMAFFPFALNAAQIAYIYNGGAGRTTPITLPA